jgi:hypothetical protein
MVIDFDTASVVEIAEWTEELVKHYGHALSGDELMAIRRLLERAMGVVAKEKERRKK